MVAASARTQCARKTTASAIKIKDSATLPNADAKTVKIKTP